MSYAISFEKLWRIYEKIGNLQKLLELLENDELNTIQ
jgi:hypothetical protein